MTALWINNIGFDTNHRHRHRGGMLTKTPPPTELQIPATVTTLQIFKDVFWQDSPPLRSTSCVQISCWPEIGKVVHYLPPP